MKTIAIITGASSGLGKEFVKQIDLDNRLDEIWLCARRKERLEELANNLKHSTQIIEGDVTDPNWLKALAEKLASEQFQIHTLINSAGLGKSGAFSEIGLKENGYIVEVNVLALTQICSICLPYMMNQGRILNIASVAAFLPQANFAVYAASKAYVLSFSRALNQELMDEKITVTTVCPNPMETEFFLHSGQKNKSQSIKNMGLEDVEKVVRMALKKSEKHKDISLSSFISKAIRLVSRIFPHPFILKIEKLIGF